MSTCDGGGLWRWSCLLDVAMRSPVAVGRRPRPMGVVATTPAATVVRPLSEEVALAEASPAEAQRPYAIATAPRVETASSRAATTRFAPAKNRRHVSRSASASSNAGPTPLGVPSTVFPCRPTRSASTSCCCTAQRPRATRTAWCHRRSTTVSYASSPPAKPKSKHALRTLTARPSVLAWRRVVPTNRCVPKIACSSILTRPRCSRRFVSAPRTTAHA